MANVALTNTSGRQWPLVALVDVSFNNIADTAVAVGNIFKLPPKAVVIGGAIDVIVASDATTSTLNIGDATVGNRYASAVNLKTLGRTVITLTDYLSDGADILLTPTNTGTATVGTFRIHITYVIAGRATEAQTN